MFNLWPVTKLLNKLTVWFLISLIIYFVSKHLMFSSWSRFLPTILSSNLNEKHFEIARKQTYRTQSQVHSREYDSWSVNGRTLLPGCCLLFQMLSRTFTLWKVDFWLSIWPCARQNDIRNHWNHQSIRRFAGYGSYGSSSDGSASD